MKLSIASSILLLVAPAIEAFAPNINTFSHTHSITPSTSLPLHAVSNNNNNSNDNNENNNNHNVNNVSNLFEKNMQTMQQQLKGAFAASVLTAALWTSPSLMNIDQQYNSISNTNNVNHHTFMWNSVQSTLVADAKEMASGSGSRVNKDPESLLRYGLPIPKDKEIRKLQATIEEIRQNVGSKRKAAAIDNVKNVKSILKAKSSTFASMCVDSSSCASTLTSMDEMLSPLDKSLKDASDYLNGSDQERNALDKAYKIQDELQKKLTVIMENMVPADYVVPIPSDYSDLPQLKGRATVEMVLNKPDKAPFDVEGVNYPEARMKMVIDGFAAPVTGGNFIDLVEKGYYTNMAIQRSDGFVVQTGDPDGPAEGYVGTPSKSVGKGKHGERLVPLEIFVKGDKGPFYEVTIEDEGRGGQATVLPFSSYGALGMAREEYDANSGGSQFFWLLFDSDLTPAGKNILDGRYPCFGYVVEGADFLRDVKESDIIVSAKVIDGAEKLVKPAVPASETA